MSESSMVVGLCEMTLRIGHARSLKAKRAVVRRVVERVKARFNVSMAETADQDVYQSARIGFAVVGNESRKIESSIDKILAFVEELYVAEIVKVEREHFGWSASIGDVSWSMSESENL